MAAANASLLRGRGNPVQSKTFAYCLAAVVDGGLVIACRSQAAVLTRGHQQDTAWEMDSAVCLSLVARVGTE